MTADQIETLLVKYNTRPGRLKIYKWILGRFGSSNKDEGIILYDNDRKAKRYITDYTNTVNWGRWNAHTDNGITKHFKYEKDGRMLTELRNYLCIYNVAQPLFYDYHTKPDGSYIAVLADTRGNTYNMYHDTKVRYWIEKPRHSKVFYIFSQDYDGNTRQHYHFFAIEQANQKLKTIALERLK